MEGISAWFESRGIPPLVAGALIAIALMVLFKVLTRSKRAHDYGAGLGGPARMPAEPPLGQADLESLLARVAGPAAQPAAKQTPTDAMHDAVRLIQAGNKIEAIKRVRAATGLGLKEAKDVVEQLAAALPR